MSQKPIFVLAVGFAAALVVVSALPRQAQGKGHGHGGRGQGAHHKAHHGGSIGLWRQSSGSPSPGTGNTPAGRPGEVTRTGHTTSPVPTTVLPSPDNP